MTDVLERELLAMRDAANLAAEDLVALQLRRQRGALDQEQFEHAWDAVVAELYTDDECRDKFLNGFLIVALTDLAAWIYLKQPE